MAAAADTKENRFRSKAAEPVTNHVGGDYSRMVGAISRVFDIRSPVVQFGMDLAMEPIAWRVAGQNVARRFLDEAQQNI
jgi:hypothetical protein